MTSFIMKVDVVRAVNENFPSRNCYTFLDR